MRQCILLGCPSLRPGWIKAHGLTDAQMMILAAVDLEAGRILHDPLHQHHRGKEGEDYGRCGHGGWPLSPGELLRRVVAIPSALPWDDRRHEPAHDREHGYGRHPCGFLEPHRADGGGMLAPANPWFYGAMLLLLGLEYLGICTALRPHGGRQDGPARRVGGTARGLGPRPCDDTGRCPGAALAWGDGRAAGVAAVGCPLPPGHGGHGNARAAAGAPAALGRGLRPRPGRPPPRRHRQTSGL